MTEIYRKQGRVVRYGSGVLTHVAEAGEAIEENGTFTCRPSGVTVDLPELRPDAVLETVHEIERLVVPPLSIERLIVSEGMSQHECGGRRWSETTRRIHLAITSGTERVLIDLGDFDVTDLRRVAAFMPLMQDEAEAPQRILLAPAVGAALLPMLVGVLPPNLRIIQSAGGVDGRGNDIGEVEIREPPWPNWYRPSYRSRPIRAPLNIRAFCDVIETDRELPEAVALLAPVDGLVIRALCVDGDYVFPATVRVNRIDAVAPLTKWYPYAAGSFGAEMML